MVSPLTFSQQTYPLNPGAILAFTLEDEQEITLKIYNNYGQIVHVIFDGNVLKSGHHQLRLYGEAFPPGVCYARLQTKQGVFQQSLALTTDAA
ncbi:MAG: hypothetical protein KFH87_08760 [Bacteroidetes bacterium]|nr:hypothetical protein [Bacteroidota bacterium]